MATQKSQAQKRSGKKASPAKPPIRREVGAVICFFLAFFTFLAMTGLDAPVLTALAVFGKWLMGWGFYVLPFALLGCSFLLVFHRGRPVRARVICALTAVVVLAALAHLFWCRQDYPWTIQFWTMLGAMAVDGAAGLSGGMLGGLLSHTLSSLVSKIGAGFVLFLGLGLTLLVTFDLTVAQIVEFFQRERVKYEPQPEPKKKPLPKEKPLRPSRMTPIDIPLDETAPHAPEEEHDPVVPVAKKKRESLFPAIPRVKTPAQVVAEQEGRAAAPAPTPAPLHGEAPSAPAPEETLPDLPEQAAPIKEPKDKTPIEIPDIDTTISKDQPAYEFPPMALLEPGTGTAKGSAQELHEKEQQLVSTIRSFGLEVQITESVRGPSVTRYELQMDTGIKLSRLTSLADDIALRLGASSVRIAPVPGKGSIVGIEIPNTLVSTVRLRDVVDSPEFKNHKSHIAFALGKDIAGKSIVGDIAKLPHLLIAGTTGSGKSVCTNSLILSLLYRSSPEDVRLIMIDPKMVELGIYNGIPHLLIPVVTDPKKAAGALQWAVTEMMRRYRLFSSVNVRDMYAYNALVAKDPEVGEKLPQIVVIIDELADLMMVAAKEVEEAICRIAQMARAAGMHLIIATQRPSADVITGLMKANIPSRIAFAVSSSLESRIILDMQGAEKLVGRGDMLFLPLGTSKPVRIQGTFVTDEEREQVVEFLKRNADSDYNDEIMAQIERQAEGKDSSAASQGGGGAPSDDDADELLPNAVDVVLDAGQASTSMLQRRLKLGYSRASRILDQLEERGFVGPFEGSKPRAVLVTRAQWDEMKLAGITVVGELSPSASPTAQESDEPPFDPDEE